MIGAFFIVVVVISFGVSVIVGGMIGLPGLLAAKNHFNSNRFVKIWVIGALVTAALWSLYIHMACNAEAAEDIIMRVAMWSALPGVLIAGGGVAHLLGIVFLKEG